MNLTSHLPRVMAALALVVGMTQCGGPAAPAEEAASAPTARLTRVGVRTMEWAPFAHSFAVQGNVETDRVANICLLYTSPSPRDLSTSRMPSSA